MVAGSLQRNYRGNNSIFFNPNGQPSPDPNPNTPIFDKVQDREYSVLQSRSGAHAKIDYRFNSNNRISLYSVFLQMDEKMHRNQLDNSFTIAGDVSILDRSGFSGNEFSMRRCREVTVWEAN
ncbi:MAG: hypothetical protein LRY55_01645 [Leadbetterella sp.]|nr:hypothetical protein [Leadbetterella sp.]